MTWLRDQGQLQLSTEDEQELTRQRGAGRVFWLRALYVPRPSGRCRKRHSSVEIVVQGRCTEARAFKGPSS